jgi:hypothetical protein
MLNPIKNELHDIISGEGKASYGAAIQTIASYLRECQKTSRITKEAKYFKKQELPVIDIIPVMAQPRQITSQFTVPASGLDNLVEVTASTLPEVQRNAFYREQNIISYPSRKLLPIPAPGKKPDLELRGVLQSAAGTFLAGVVVGIGIGIALFKNNETKEDTKNSDKEQEDTKNTVDHEGSDDEG